MTDRKQASAFLEEHGAHNFSMALAIRFAAECVAAERARIITELRRKANVGKVGADQQKGTVGFAVTASFAAAYNDFANELEAIERGTEGK